LCSQPVEGTRGCLGLEFINISISQITEFLFCFNSTGVGDFWWKTFVNFFLEDIFLLRAEVFPVKKPRLLGKYFNIVDDLLNDHHHFKVDLKAKKNAK